LRLDGTQCKNEAGTQNDDPDHPHRHLGGGWLAESLAEKSALQSAVTRDC